MRNHPQMQASVTTYPSTALWLGERIEPLTCKHSVFFLLPWFCPVWGFPFVSFPLLIPVYILPGKKNRATPKWASKSRWGVETVDKSNPLFFQPGGWKLSGLSRFEPNQQWSVEGQAVRLVSGQRTLWNLSWGREKGSQPSPTFFLFTRIKPRRIPKN